MKNEELWIFKKVLRKQLNRLIRLGHKGPMVNTRIEDRNMIEIETSWIRFREAKRKRNQKLFYEVLYNSRTEKL